MSLSFTRWFPLALLFALAALSFWLERTVREEEVHPALRRHDPDYIVDRFTITTFNAEGVAQSTLSAAKMMHYPDDDSTDLVAPHVVQSRPREPRLTLTAERGALSQDGTDVFLYDNVLVVREANDERPQTTMRTSFLHIVPEKSLVLTDRDVAVSEEGRSLTGRGMEYHNETGEMFLRERVRGVFEPGKKAP